MEFCENSGGSILDKFAESVQDMTQIVIEKIFAGNME